jgi:hypothetical protein
MILDSAEETWCVYFLDELKKHDLIKDYKYHEIVYYLSEKVTIPSTTINKGKEKVKDRFIFHDHIYTPDFTIYWTQQGLDLMTEKSRYFKYFTGGYFELSYRFNHYVSIIDVKGSFNGRNNTTAVTFPLNQKWVYQQTGDIVQKIIPAKLFEETFYPERYMFMDNSNKPRRKKVVGVGLVDLSCMKLPKIEDYLKKRKEVLCL